MAVYDQIQKLCEQNGTTITALEKELGYSKSSILKYKKSVPSSERLHQIAGHFRVPVEFLLTGEFPEGNTVPMYEYVAAGAGALMTATPAGTMELTPSDGYDYFAVRVKGNSMYPKIADGDIVVVRKQNDVDSGEIAVVTVNGEEATVKQIIKSEAGVTLVGLNANDFTPAFYSNDQVIDLPINVLGKVIKVVSEL